MLHSSIPHPSWKILPIPNYFYFIYAPLWISASMVGGWMFTLISAAQPSMPSHSAYESLSICVMGEVEKINDLPAMLCVGMPGRRQGGGTR